MHITKITFALLLSCSILPHLYAAEPHQLAKLKAMHSAIIQNAKSIMAGENPDIMQLLLESTPLSNELCRLVVQYHEPYLTSQSEIAIIMCNMSMSTLYLHTLQCKQKRYTTASGKHLIEKP